MSDLPMGSEMVSEMPGPKVLRNMHACLNEHKKRTECCGNVIL